MGIYKRAKNRRSAGKRSMKVGRRPSRVVRKAGAYGLYRSTKFASLRSAARGAIHAPRLPSAQRGSLFPQSGKFSRHKYCDIVTMPASAVAGAISTYVFRANSTYDPDYTGTGHQPMFRDEMVTHYNKYTVMWSSIKVVVPNYIGQAAIWGIALTDDPAEISSSSSRTDTLEQYTHSNVNRGDKRPAPQVFKKGFSATKEFKTNRAGIMADDFKAVSTGTNPDEGRYFVIWVMPLLNEVLTEIKLQVEMIQGVQWRYSKPAGGS